MAKITVKIVVLCILGTVVATKMAWYYTIFMLIVDFFCIVLIANNNTKWRKNDQFKKSCEAFKINRKVVFNMESRRVFDKKDWFVLQRLMTLKYGHNYQKSRNRYLLCYQLGWYRSLEENERQLDGYEKQIERLEKEVDELSDENVRLQFTLSHLSRVEEVSQHVKSGGTDKMEPLGQENDQNGSENNIISDLETLRGQGKSIREIAALTGLSKSTVQRRLQERRLEQ